MHRVVLQHTTGFYVASHARYIRFNVETSHVDGTVVELSFFYSYDAESSVWQKLGSSARATVCDGLAQFVVCLGASDVSEGLNNQTILSFPRRAEGSIELPLLSYILSTADGVCFLSGHLRPFASWRELVHSDATVLFDSIRGQAAFEFVSVSAVYEALRQRWNDLFKFIADRHQREIDGQIVHVYPEGEEPLVFGEQLFKDLVRAAIYSDFVPTDMPSLITRRLLCGEVDGTCSSIMYLFHNLVDLLGRSEYVRTLYRTGRITLIAKSDDSTVRVRPDADTPRFLFTLRLPRSFVSQPVLVMEPFTIDNEGKVTHLTPVPYISAGQLEVSNGNPLLAFSRLVSSVHHALLVNVLDKNMLRPVRLDTTTYQLRDPEPFDIKPRYNDCHLDREWWSSKFPLQSHN